MHARRLSARIMSGLVLLSVAGCYSYHPYGYRGYPSYPGQYAMPPAGTVSPTPVYPQGATLMSPTAVPGSATQAYNPSPTGAGTYDGQLPQWQPSPQPADTATGGDAFDDTSGNNPVPDYHSPSDQPPASAEDDLFGDEPVSSPFDEQSNLGVELQGIETQAQTNGVTLGTPVALDLTEAANGDGFAEPVPFTPVSTTRSVDSETVATTVSRPNPYDYDRKNYSWLRGVVDFDERDRTWNLIYSVSPDPNDEFGGSITLVDDPQLDVLRNNDVVLVEGRIDETQRDQLGKPKYRFDHFSRLVPKR